MKELPKLNAEWHKKNKMPAHATLEERIAWHNEHLAHCRCRTGYPEKLLMEMKKRGIAVDQ
jgi:hypothetical protein